PLIGGLVRLGRRGSGPEWKSSEQGCSPCDSLLQAGAVLYLVGAVGEPGDHDGPRGIGGGSKSVLCGTGLGAGRRLAVCDPWVVGGGAEFASDRGVRPIASRGVRALGQPRGPDDGPAWPVVGAAQPGGA